MHILLKNIVEGDEQDNPLMVQIYCDMDGVLTDMDGGFKRISGGLTPKEYSIINGKNSPWKLIGTVPNFWLNLDKLPDANVLWNFIRMNFKTPPPVVLSAGMGSIVLSQKKQWIHTHIDSTATVLIAQSGQKKSDCTLSIHGRVTHVLIDDTQKNVDVWQNKSPDHIAIFHKNALSSIDQLKAFLPK